MVNNRRPGAGSRAMTLIELIVVVALVTLLLALLMPSLANARLAAQSVQCQARLWQIGIATANYAMDERQGLPVAQYVSGSVDQLWPITGRYQRYMNIDPADRSWSGPFMCPTYTHSPSPRSTWDHNPVLLNNSYTVNRSLGQFFNFSSNPMWPSPWWRKPTRLTLIRNPSASAWVIDGSYRDAMRVHAYADPDALTFTHGPTLDRHPGHNNNLLFFDGHVQARSGQQVRAEVLRFWTLPGVAGEPPDPMAP
jgi:prepilin-type processing-associated H-X9-DG protein